MKNNLLKTLALKAKNRMINYGNDFAFLDKRIKIINVDDNDFVEKVREIIQNDDNIMNPLKLLMDENKLINLDERGKERYLLETMDKYLKAKAQIEKENQANCC